MTNAPRVRPIIKGQYSHRDFARESKTRGPVESGIKSGPAGIGLDENNNIFSSWKVDLLKKVIKSIESQGEKTK